MAILSYVSVEADLTVGYVYKWTNLVNGMMYIGSHKGHRPGYTASGTRIKRAFKKYGMENFQREILYVGPQFREVETEMLLIIDAAGSQAFYNLVNQNPTHVPWNQSEVTRAKISAGNKGKVRTVEHRKNMSEARQNLSEQARRNISEGQKGKTLVETQRQALLKATIGRKRSPLELERLSYSIHINRHIIKGQKASKKPCLWCAGKPAPKDCTST